MCKISVIPQSSGEKNIPTPQNVVVNTAGPAWNHDLSFMEQNGVMDHAGYFFGLANQGKIERGGPFLSTKGGFMIFAEGVSEDEAKAIAVADPGVTSGLLNYEVRLWMQAIKP